MERFDCVVVGVGAAGSAALAELARRGVRALGLERLAPGHDRGSSHGATRATRTAYFEHPDYVPLLRASNAAWRELDAATDETLLVECGILEAGPEDGELVPGVLRSAEEHGLDVERLDAAGLARRAPALRLPDGIVGLFEREAGFLDPEACVRTLARQATSMGAQLWSDCELKGWREESGALVVETSRGSLQTTALILTQGAWAAQALASLGLQLEVARKPQLWFAADPAGPAGLAAGFVPFCMETGDGRVFYGFPALDRRGLKAAEHTGGAAVPDPSRLDRDLHDGDLAPTAAFLAAHFPGVAGPCGEHAVCMYTRTTDGHFVVDRHPAHPRVAFAAGLSGHGFKFAPVLGRALADLALEGGSGLPIGFLSAARLGAGA